MVELIYKDEVFAIQGAVFEVYKNLDNYEITLEGDTYISYYMGTAQGNVEILDTDEDIHTVILSGRKNGTYEFTISDNNDHAYTFEYHFDKENNFVDVNMIE